MNDIRFNKNITILDLNEKNFAPYGRIVDIPTSVAAVEKTNLSYWHELYKEELPGDICLGFLQIRNQQMVITEMERHHNNCEIFIPVSGKAIMPFAPSNTEQDNDKGPDESKVVFFILDGTKSFLINKGVWHTPALPLGEVINFLMVLPKGILDDIDNRLVNKIPIDHRIVDGAQAAEFKTSHKDISLFCKWRVPTISSGGYLPPRLISSGGDHISRLVETHRGKKIFLQPENFLLMRYKM